MNGTPARQQCLVEVEGLVVSRSARRSQLLCRSLGVNVRAVAEKLCMPAAVYQMHREKALGGKAGAPSAQQFALQQTSANCICAG